MYRGLALCFDRWYTQVQRKRRYLRLVQSVQARLTQRALTRAYHHWSYHTAVQVKAKARRHHTTQQQGQLARFKARLATMAMQRVARVLVSHWTKWAFHAWRRTTDHDKYHATMLRLSSRHARVHLLTRSLACC